MAFLSLRNVISVLILLLSTLLPTTTGAGTAEYITYTSAQNEVLYLEDYRKPSLYTQHFADCLGNGRSQLTITRFDAALYMDNMTVTFHIQGTTALKKESVMMYLGVYAYGESRFEVAFNPCGTNIYSLCPAQSTVPIEASGYIPLGIQDVATIPSVAFSIPDFEGQAILRLFANSTQTEIGCYTAAVTNGSTFNQEESVSVILAIFTIVAIAASFATAIYGATIPEIRTHYAHSLSVLVVFAVFHHIYFTGALSMNWPSVIVAWQANFSWAAGMIYTTSMQNSISKLMGKHLGNTLVLGAARAGADSSSVGGGYDVHKIYKRFSADHIFGGSLSSRNFEKKLAKRVLANSTMGFKWYSSAVRSGLPLPGNYSGFAGTLSVQGIPASNAFLTGLIWLLILFVIVAGSIAATKFALEGLYRFKYMETEKLSYFRSHWKGYLIAALLRTCYIAFFAMMFLSVFQFTYDGAPPAIAIAAIVFAIFFVGMFAIAGYACHYRLRVGAWASEPDRIFLEKKKVMGFIPWYNFIKGSEVHDGEKAFAGSLPSWKISHTPPAGQIPVHADEEYIKKFGWLASRFRLSKWWFFIAWLVYEFVRACFYAGASGHPLVQVFGLLIVEFIAFIAIMKIRPYEGQRLNIIMVYLLGFSKVATVALSAAFDINFNLKRIPATAIGIVIIVIQGILTITLLVCIVLSAISSFFSLTRNRESIRPRRWMPYRERYYAHIAQASTDIRSLPSAPDSETPVEPKGPYFSVNSVRRIAKIEDEDPEFQNEIAANHRSSSRLSLHATNPQRAQAVAGPSTTPVQSGKRLSRTASVGSNASRSSLPYGARAHRRSWSTAQFVEYQADRDLSAERRRPVSNYVPAFQGNDIVASPRPDDTTFGQDSIEGNVLPGSQRHSLVDSQFHTAVGSPVISRSTSGSGLGGASNAATAVDQTARPETPPRAKSPSVTTSSRGSPASSASSSARARFSRERGSVRSNEQNGSIKERVEVDLKEQSST